MTAAAQLVWEEKVDDLAKAMLLLIYWKNISAKKDIYLAFAQGNHSACPQTVEKMARFLLSQYWNKNINPNNNLWDKNGDKNGKKGDEAKSEDKNRTTQVLQVYTLEKR